MIRFIVPYLIYSAAALLGIFLQSEIFTYLQIFHAKPDLLLLLVVMSALKTDWKNGVVVGLLVGFWIDLMNAAYFGSNMVVYAVVGAAFGTLGTRFPHRTYEGYFFTAVAGSLLSGILMLGVLSMLGAPMFATTSIGGIVIPMTFYNALIAFFCLPLVWFHRRNNRRKIHCIDLLGAGIVSVRGNEEVDIEAKRKQKASHREKQRGKNNSKQKTRKSRGSAGLFGGLGNKDKKLRKDQGERRGSDKGASPKENRSQDRQKGSRRGLGDDRSRSKSQRHSDRRGR